MMWGNVTFFTSKKNGEDELGNALMEQELLVKTIGRVAKWTSDEVMADGRGLTKQSCKLITDATVGDLEQATHVEIKGKQYELGELLNGSHRWRIIVVEKYGL